MIDGFEAAFAAAKRACGNETKLAKACGVSQNSIWAAKKAGKVSAELAVKIESATKGEVARWQLRPDLWDAPASEPEAA